MFFEKLPFHSERQVERILPDVLLPPDEETAWRNGSKNAVRRHLVPAFKLLVALAVLGIGSAALLSEQGRVASNNAVVSTHVVSLRAPIDGIVSGVLGGVGTTFSRGETIATISNPWFDDQRLVDLQATLDRLNAQRRNAETDKTDLLVLAAKLEERVSIHTRANAERLRGLVMEAEKASATLVTKQNQAQFDVDRQIPLQASGVVSRAEAQRRVSLLESARQDVAAQMGRLASLRAEADAAASGVLASPGGIDVSYSAQRADQIAIDVANLTRLIADLTAEAQSVATRLATEDQRAARMRSANLTAPVAGMIWRLGASNGERLATGDMAVEIVDCAAAVLLATIPQARFPDMKIGALAHYRLSGETVERTGTVLSVTGQGESAHDERYAVRPPSEPMATIMVQVAMSGEDLRNAPCLIGRTAKVLLPTSGGGFLDWVSRRNL